MSCIISICNAKNTFLENNYNSIYVEYIIEELPSTRASQTRVGKKTANVKSGNTVLWSVTVTGTFEYTGTTSICTKSEVSTTCPSSSWKISSQSATKSGASATAKATAKRYSNGAVVETRTESVVLICGTDGTLY